MNRLELKELREYIKQIIDSRGITTPHTFFIAERKLWVSIIEDPEETLSISRNPNTRQRVLDAAEAEIRRIAQEKRYRLPERDADDRKIRLAQVVKELKDAAIAEGRRPVQKRVLHEANEKLKAEDPDWMGYSETTLPRVYREGLKLLG